MSTTHEEVLAAALPGREYRPPEAVKSYGWPEHPWKYWKGAGKKWAVYPVSGGRFGESAANAVKAASTMGLTPLIVIRSNEEVAAIAERYAELQCHVACPIGGSGALIPPLTVTRSAATQSTSATRIPISLLNEIHSIKGTPRYFQLALHRLILRYGEIHDRGRADDKEREALLDFLRTMLQRMGCHSQKVTPNIIRSLEKAGWGGSRDHFFHSFQNFFFGLLAIARLPIFFNAYRDFARLHWDIDALHVWLLTALWHDVGYSYAKLEDINEDVIGAGFGEAAAEGQRASFLKSAAIQEGLSTISSLIARLLEPKSAKTEWMLPVGRPRSKKSHDIRQAIEASFLDRGHGAGSALRLYFDFMPATRHLHPDNQSVLRQTILLACSSLPFHEDNFRSCLRTTYGAFSVSTTSMPFASLLAFIDSIQDDRRDLDGLVEEIEFLQGIAVSFPATVEAEVNMGALLPAAVLWKIIEARDVLAHLHQTPDTLCFKYPAWMVS